VQVLLRASNGASLTVRADRTRLRQILLNLTSNAIKYNRRGGHVTLQAELDGANVRITVADDGVGMSAEQVGALYQPFNRLGREQGEVEGTGIGLVIARSLTELMGGRISVHSEPDRGSSFVIELGGSRGPGPAMDFADSAPLPMVREEVTGCVLYVDDDEVNRVLMESFLQHRPGIRLLMASDGESGLRLAREHRPDLVLLDILLPGLDGFEILQRLRADADLAGTPCVAVSASAMAGEIDSAMSAGFDHYLTKPLTFATVLQEIDRQLERDGAAGSA
jgi:CheY-like chemotaxis protein